MSHLDRFLSGQITYLPNGNIWFPPTIFECPCTIQNVPQNYLFFLMDELNLEEDEVLCQLTMHDGDIKKLLESYTSMVEM